MKKKIEQRSATSDENEKYPLPIYNAEDDIYNKAKEEPLDEEEVGDTEVQAGHLPGDDLDIPGSELDDADEAIGEEDEENNYYSLGGDNHDDLEESQDS